MALKNKEISLRLVKISDAALIAKWNSDPEIFRLTSNRKNTSPKVRKWLKTIFSDQNEICWIIQHNNRPIGFITLSVTKENNFGIISTTLDINHVGHGYGIQARRLALRHAFRKLKLHKVFVEIFSFNARAIQSCLRQGFRFEGIGREETLVNGKYYDDVWLGLLSCEFMDLERNDANKKLPRFKYIDE
jgi:diamine N-acetyltransferase